LTCRRKGDKIKLGKGYAIPWTELNQRIKQLSMGVGVGCGEQAFVAWRKPKTSIEAPT